MNQSHQAVDDCLGENQDPNWADINLTRQVDAKKKKNNRQQHTKLIELLRSNNIEEFKRTKDTILKLNEDKCSRKLNVSTKFSEVYERMKHCEQKAQEKIGMLSEQVEKDRLKQCTFIPKRKSKRGKSTAGQSVQESSCLNSLQQSKLPENDNLEELSRVSSVIRHHTPLDDNSCLFYRKSNKNTERRKCKSFHEIPRKKDYTFKPDILRRSKEIQRDEPIDQILMRDARRRENQLKQRIKVEHAYQEELDTFKTKKSFQSFVHKFNKDFETALRELDHEAHTHLLPDECFLDFQQFKQVLESLYYIRFYDSMAEIDKNKIEEMWTIMGGKEYLGVSKSKLKKALLVIQGILDEHKHNLKSNGSRNALHFQNMDWQKIETLSSFNSLFGCLVNNRKCNIEKSIDLSDNPTFKPNTLKCSARLAQNHRKKFVSENPKKKKEKQTLMNYFQLHQKAVEKKNQMKKQEQQEEQLKHCTFKPELISVRKRDKPKEPMFSMEVNMGDQKIEQIFIYHDDTPALVMEKLRKKYDLTEEQKERFEKIIISSLSKRYCDQLTRQSK